MTDESLNAGTRQLSEDDREALTRAVASVTDLWDEPLDEVHDLPPVVNAILAAGFSRAAVPDAATELAQAKTDMKTISEVSRATFDRLKAERDAALAAIERCRRVIASWKSVQASNREQFESGNPGMIVPIDCVGGLSAALDGAPEPEWEWAASKGDPGAHHLTVFSKDPETLTQRNEGRKRLGHEPLPIWRRRKAGPWERAERSES